MNIPRSENLFIELFETYADDFFRESLAALGDRGRALRVTEEAFFRTWDQMEKGLRPEIGVIRASLEQLIRSNIKETRSFAS